MAKTLIALSLALAAAVISSSPTVADPTSNPSPNASTQRDGAWPAWQLVDWHQRPKFVIGTDRRPLRKAFGDTKVGDRDRDNSQRSESDS